MLLTTVYFFFNDPASTEIYTLSLHDALPISKERTSFGKPLSSFQLIQNRLARMLAEITAMQLICHRLSVLAAEGKDRKSTRLNSSHANISYAVFCLKKKKKNKTNIQTTT